MKFIATWSIPQDKWVPILKKFTSMSPQEQKNAAIYERIGDLEAGRNHSVEARAAYESAIQNAPDSQTAKRIRKKLK